MSKLQETENAQVDLYFSVDRLLEQKGLNLRKINRDNRVVKVSVDYFGESPAEKEIPGVLNEFIAEKYRGRQLFLSELEIWYPFDPSSSLTLHVIPEGATGVERTKTSRWEELGVIIEEDEIVLGREIHILFPNYPMAWAINSYLLKDWQRKRLPERYKELEGEVDPSVVRAIASIIPELPKGSDTRLVDIGGQMERVLILQPKRSVYIV